MKTRPPPPQPREDYHPIPVSPDCRPIRLFYLALYPGDLLSDPYFVGLSLAARGAIFTLFLYQWQSSTGALPSDRDGLCRLLGVSTDDWQELEPAIERWFPPDGCGGRLNIALFDQRREAASKVEKNRAAANKRWGKS